MKSPTRRKIIGNLLKGGCGLSFLGPTMTLTACRDRMQASNITAIDPNINYDCIVIGAGIAGVTVARTLQELWRGQLNILIVEGDNRIGGRISTLRDHFRGPVELGAEFIHRDPGEIDLWHFVNAYKLKTVTIPKMRESLIFHPQWQGGKKALAASIAWNMFRAMMMFPAIEFQLGSDKTAQQWLDRKKYRGVGRDFVAMALTGHMPAYLDDLSIKGFDEDDIAQQLQEPNEYYIESGYDNLIRHMAVDLPLALNTPIKQIVHNWRGSYVTTTDNMVFKGKTVVFTGSVGMLKSGQIEFTPGLHPLKQQALNYIKVGHHTKVIMQFKRKFWPEKLSMAHFPWRGRRAGMTYFHVFYGQREMPPVLTALIMGEDAARLDKKSLTEVLQLICADLDQMFPKAAPTYSLLARKIDGAFYAVRKSWMQDPFAKGGNSYLAVGDEPDLKVTAARKILANPDFHPGLFLAGEALATTTQPASVHGACASGLETAYNVTRFLKGVWKYDAPQIPSKGLLYELGILR